MRPIPLILIAAALAATAYHHHARIELPALLHTFLPSKTIATLPPIKEIRTYTDADFHFTMAVPNSWIPIIADEPLSELEQLETSYAVGFESARTAVGDRFADYIMVEIIPGNESGAFETDGSLEKAIMIDGFPAKEDELLLRDYRVADDKLDLQVYQAQLYRLGYTVGFYAIGEHREAQVLRDAFRLMIETFKLPPNLFNVS